MITEPKRLLRKFLFVGSEGERCQLLRCLERRRGDARLAMSAGSPVHIQSRGGIRPVVCEENCDRCQGQQAEQGYEDRFFRGLHGIRPRGDCNMGVPMRLGKLSRMRPETRVGKGEAVLYRNMDKRTE